MADVFDLGFDPQANPTLADSAEVYRLRESARAKIDGVKAKLLAPIRDAQANGSAALVGVQDKLLQPVIAGYQQGVAAVKDAQAKLGTQVIMHAAAATEMLTPYGVSVPEGLQPPPPKVRKPRTRKTSASPSPAQPVAATGEGAPYAPVLRPATAVNGTPLATAGGPNPCDLIPQLTVYAVAGCTATTNNGTQGPFLVYGSPAAVNWLALGTDNLNPGHAYIWAAMLVLDVNTCQTPGIMSAILIWDVTDDGNPWSEQGQLYQTTVGAVSYLLQFGGDASTLGIGFTCSGAGGGGTLPGGGGGGGTGTGTGGGCCPDLSVVNDAAQQLVTSIAELVGLVKDPPPLPIDFASPKEIAAAAAEGEATPEEESLTGEPDPNNLGFVGAWGGGGGPNPPPLQTPGGGSVFSAGGPATPSRGPSSGQTPPLNFGTLAGILSLDFNSPAICDSLATIQSTLGSLTLVNLLQTIGVLDSSSNVKQLVDAATAAVNRGGISGRATAGFYRALNNTITALVTLIDSLAQTVGRGAANAVVGNSVKMLMNALEGPIVRWAGVTLEPLRASADYVTNAINPTQLPTAQEANAAYLGGTIDENLWRCWVTANDQLPNPAQAVVLAGQSWPDPTTLNVALRRGLITPDQWKSTMRSQGWLNETLRDVTFQVSNYVPGTSDLISFMLKDVEDKNVYERFNLDAEFTQKFAGNVAKWAAWQGVDADTMKYYWRAHWQNMPWTQLKEMLFRLRPDKYDGNKDAAGYPLAVQAQDVFDALGQNDVPPFWRYKLMEIAYATPRLVDVRNAYLKGLVDESTLKSLLLDRGNSPDNAAVLVQIYQRNRRDQLRKSEWLKLYMQNAINADAASQQLAADGYPPGEVLQALSYAQTKMDAARRARCVKSIEKRFLRGDIAQADLAAQLRAQGLDSDQVVRAVTDYACLLATRSKDLTVANIKGAVAAGLITSEVGLIRLTRLGLSAGDAQLILGIEDAKAAAKAAKAAQKKPRELTEAQIVRLFKKREMSEADALARLQALGLSAADAALRLQAG